MPNHVVNVLEIFGSEEQIRAVRDFIKTENLLISFQRVLPKPACLNVPSLSATSEVAEWEISVEDGKPRAKPSDEAIKYARNKVALVERLKQNIRDCGFPTWLEWCSHFWGTKWDAYRQEEISASKIKFETAWTTPRPIFEKLTELFPEVIFVIQFADEDIGYNQGVLVCHDHSVSFEHYPFGSKEARIFAYQVRGYDQKTIQEFELNYAEA